MVAGDWNADPYKKSGANLRILNKVLDETSLKLIKRPSPKHYTCFTPGRSSSHIDHFLVSDNIAKCVVSPIEYHVDAKLEGKTGSSPDHIPLVLTIGGLRQAQTIHYSTPAQQNPRFNVELLSIPNVAASFAKGIAAGLKVWGMWLTAVEENEGTGSLNEDHKKNFVEVCWEGLILTLYSAAENTIGRIP